MTAKSLADFEHWWSSALATLKVGKSMKVILGDGFTENLVRDHREIDWEYVEEVQMMIRLEKLPEGYWACLRGKAVPGELYVGLHRSH
jgi:hypothetical protein